MANDIYTTTPGSAVADTIQQILQRRRDESRQALVDKLNEDRYRADMANDTERLGLERRRTTSDEQTAALSREQLKQQMLAQQLGMMGDEVDLSTIDPEIAIGARKYGMFEHTPAPSVGTSANFTMPIGADANAQATTSTLVDATATPPTTGGKDVFMSPKRRAEKLQEREIADYITANPELAKNPTLMSVLNARASGVDAPLTGEMFGPEPSLQPIGPNGKPVGAAITRPRGTQFMEMGYPPIPPAAYQAPQQWYIQDPNNPDKFITIERQPGQPLDPKHYINMGPAPTGITGTGPAGNIGAYPPQSSSAAQQFTPETQQLRMALTNTGPNRDQAIAVAKSALLAKAGRLFSPGAAQALNDTVDSMAKAVRPATSADLPGALAEIQRRYPNLSPNDLQNVRDVIQIYLSAGEQ